MRTQLLHVVPVGDPETECDYDRAANDEPTDSSIVAPRRMLSLAAVPEALAPQAGAVRSTRKTNDDYWLDGYAGI